MSVSNTIIIGIVIAVALYLIYNQSIQPKYQTVPFCAQCERFKQLNTGSVVAPVPAPPAPLPPAPLIPAPPAALTNITIDYDTDPYSDPIKKQDLYGMYDPLTYPQLRLPREVLQKYNEYYQKTGSNPPFNQSTQPYLFDNPILNGLLIKQTDDNEPFSDNVPSSIPLFKVKSSKNPNRFFYYILDQRYYSKVELKIPLDHVKVNGLRYNNADFYGLNELFDGDLIEDIVIYPGAKFKVLLYKTYTFP